MKDFIWNPSVFLFVQKIRKIVAYNEMKKEIRSETMGYYLFISTCTKFDKNHYNNFYCLKNLSTLIMHFKKYNLLDK